MDRLLQFLVDSSGDGTEVVHCANCDLECSKQAGMPGGGPGPRVPGLTALMLPVCAQHVLRPLSVSGFSKT